MTRANSWDAYRAVKCTRLASAGLTHVEIINDYPELTEKTFLACLANRDEEDEAARGDV